MCICIDVMKYCSDFIMLFMLSFIIMAVVSQEIYNLSNLEFVQLLERMVYEGEIDLKENDIKFFLLTRKKSGFPEQITSDKINAFDISKPTKFIIHGWIENYKVGWYTEMKDEFLKYEDVNVVYVDWEKVAKTFYILSAKNSKQVGEMIGRFIVKNKLPTKNLHLIGHSLGAHIAAFASKFIKKTTGRTVWRISALDPAGPYFRLPDKTENDKLDRKDAEIVDVIHTDAKIFGMDGLVGTLDIYVNGGTRRQPGCDDGRLSLDLQVSLKNSLCSHARSHAYFIQSINNADIVCKKCHSYEDLVIDNCSSRDVYRITHQNITKDMKGLCSVSTTSYPPYFVN
ncbi:pancreatic lipase-related protein 2-like [Harmonia axyridis]|uniref:pancreatic lipase-related protein 2-like n=1 Tax=Harmonia axyridis TaxID=115357 RepID=UPI001E27856A|nr:pancreatic lipase-related protein 2-like [Harmonia axyridis]